MKNDRCQWQKSVTYPKSLLWLKHQLSRIVWMTIIRTGLTHFYKHLNIRTEQPPPTLSLSPSVSLASALLVSCPYWNCLKKKKFAHRISCELAMFHIKLTAKTAEKFQNTWNLLVSLCNSYSFVETSVFRHLKLILCSCSEFGCPLSFLPFWVIIGGFSSNALVWVCMCMRLCVCVCVSLRSQIQHLKRDSKWTERERFSPDLIFWSFSQSTQFMPMQNISQIRISHFSNHGQKVSVFIAADLVSAIVFYLMRI